VSSVDGPMFRTYCNGSSDTITTGAHVLNIPPAIAHPNESYFQPPMTAAREYTYVYDSLEDREFSIVICMTRETADQDGDGLPDIVDLDPTRPASALELGIPGGPPDTPIPSRYGGPAGVRGLPSCPAAP
jgi:hypothetical protein